MSFKTCKHIALEDLDFYDDEMLCDELQSWSDSEDLHYIIPFMVIEEQADGADEWEHALSDELIRLGAKPREVIFIETDF